MVCKSCNSSNLEMDPTLGILYCTSCGMIDEGDLIVSAVEFTENKELCGQIINPAGNYVKIGGQMVAVANNYVENTIKTISESLGLTEEQAASAFRWYKLSLQHNLTKGRSIHYTLSACIYIVCRQESTPHMLIDFSSLLKINVFKIGKIFSKIVNLLSVKVPMVDPSLYIHRFYKKLEYVNGDILKLAMKLLSRMKRDWIVVGRRPNNICGAALLVAGRVYGEERSLTEVARAVNVSIITINKRLNELKKTSSAKLSITEFFEVWIEAENDPPCFSQQTKEESSSEEDKENICNKKTVKLNHQKENIPNIETESPSDEESIDKLILTQEESKRREKVWNRMYKTFLDEKEKNKSKIKKKVKKRKVQKHESVKSALGSVIKEKKLTNKINYAVLKNLFD